MFELAQNLKTNYLTKWTNKGNVVYLLEYTENIEGLKPPSAIYTSTSKWEFLHTDAIFKLKLNPVYVPADTMNTL